MADLPGEGVSILWSGKPSGDGAEHFGRQAHFFPFCCSEPVAEGAGFVSVSVKSLGQLEYCQRSDICNESDCVIR